MKKSVKILVFCTIFVVSGAFAQKNDNNSTQLSAFFFNKNLYSKGFQPQAPAAAVPLRLSPIPGNYYATGLGFFCKQEIKIEKIIKFPFKFRLGSVEDCDRLEGKGLAR